MKKNQNILKIIPLFLLMVLLLLRYLVFKDINFKMYLVLLIVTLLVSIAIVIYNFKNLTYRKASKSNKILIFSIGIFISISITIFKFFEI
jgi:hypothetical protein